MMIRNTIMLLISTSLTGCTMFPSVVEMNLHPTSEHPQTSETDIANLPVGAEVEVTQTISENSSSVTWGTVLKAGPSGAVLCNCTRERGTLSVQPSALRYVPFASRLFKKSGVGRERIPVQWVNIRQEDSVRVISPPPQGYVAPDLGIHLDYQPDLENLRIRNEHAAVSEAEGDPTSDLVIPSPPISESDVANLPVGASVKIVRSPSYDCSYGTVMQSGKNGVALCNVTRDGRTPGGPPPMLRNVPFASRFFRRTGVGRNQVPVEWIPFRQMISAEVINPPPQGYVAPDLALNLDDGHFFERIGTDHPF